MEGSNVVAPKMTTAQQSLVADYLGIYIATNMDPSARAVVLQSVDLFALSCRHQDPGWGTDLSQKEYHLHDLVAFATHISDT